MLRSFFITLSKAGWVKNVVTHWGVAWRAASRFIAGETREDGIRVAQELNSRGMQVTLDFLGENTETEQDAEAATEEILSLLDAIQQAGVRSNVSIKLSQFGLVLDEALCRQNVERICQRAKEYGNFVRIDMEESALADKTLGIYYGLRDRGYDNCGVVIQAYLYRSEEDIRRLAGMNGRVRLCKGAYQEPADRAYPKKNDVDANYDHLATLLLEAARNPEAPLASEDGRFPPLAAIATHDMARISYVQNSARLMGLPNRSFEFQMLYGIRRDIQDRLAAASYPLRIYVPYGTHWYPYYMRRLAERPANVWFFLSNFFRR